MLRGILAVVVGYFAMAIWVFVTMTIAWFVLGQSFAFQEGTTEVTTGWSIVAIALGFPGAMLGGWVAALISRSPTNRPVKVLAGLVLVLGLLQGVMYLTRSDAEGGEEQVAQEEVGELTVLEAASQAVPPTWYSFTLPFVAMVGVLIGGSLKRSPATAAPTGPGGA